MITVLLQRDDLLFNSRWLNKELPQFPRQLIYHHLKELSKDGALIALGGGDYKISSREQLMAIYEISIIREPTNKRILPTEFINTEVVKHIHQTIRIAAALDALGHPVGQSIKDRLLKELGESINSLKQGIALVHGTKVTKKQASSFIDTLDDGTVEKLIRQEYPENHEEMSQVYATLISHYQLSQS